MAIHSFHRFIHSCCVGINPINTAFTVRPGPQLWITAGLQGRAIDSPNRYLSEMDRLAKHPQTRAPGPPVRTPSRLGPLRPTVTQNPQLGALLREAFFKTVAKGYDRGHESSV